MVTGFACKPWSFSKAAVVHIDSHPSGGLVASAGLVGSGAPEESVSPRCSAHKRRRKSAGSVVAVPPGPAMVLPKTMLVSDSRHWVGSPFDRKPARAEPRNHSLERLAVACCDADSETPLRLAEPTVAQVSSMIATFEWM